MFSISPYKLEMYLRCPRQYKFQYVDGLSKQYHKDTPPLVIGSLIHNTLNHYYRRIKPEERNLEKLREVFKQKFLDHFAKEDPGYKLFGGDQKQVNEWVEKAKKQLENFYNSDQAQIEPFIAPERNPTHELEDENISLTGKLDRVDKDKDGLKIIDYKTGKLWEQDVDPLQLNFYHLLLNYIYPDEIVAKKIYYYLDEDKQVEVPIKESETDQTYELVVDTVEKIQKDKEFPAQPNPNCKFCDFQTICPFFQKEESKEDQPF